MFHRMRTSILSTRPLIQTRCAARLQCSTGPEGTWGLWQQKQDLIGCFLMLTRSTNRVGEARLFWCLFTTWSITMPLSFRLVHVTRKVYCRAFCLEAYPNYPSCKM